MRSSISRAAKLVTLQMHDGELPVAVYNYEYDKEKHCRSWSVKRGRILFVPAGANAAARAFNERLFERFPAHLHTLLFDVTLRCPETLARTVQFTSLLQVWAQASR